MIYIITVICTLYKLTHLTSSGMCIMLKNCRDLQHEWITDSTGSTVKNDFGNQIGSQCLQWNSIRANQVHLPKLDLMKLDIFNVSLRKRHQCVSSLFLHRSANSWFSHHVCVNRVVHVEIACQQKYARQLLVQRLISNQIQSDKRHSIIFTKLFKVF